MKTVLLLSILVLTACAGGGGGGNVYSGITGCTDSTATNYNPLATADDGSCFGGSGSTTTVTNGSAAYYGVSTDVNTISSNQSTLPTGGNLLTITNQFSVNVRNSTTRVMDLFIYQPTCLNSSTTEEYAVVLVSGSNTAPMIGVLTVSSSSLSFQERIVSFSNFVSSSETVSGMYDYGSSTSYTGSCSSGQFTPNSGGVSFSNGKMVVWRNGSGDVYVGTIKNTAPSTSSVMQSKQYKKYIQYQSGALNPQNTSQVISSNSGGVSTDSSSSASSFAASFQISSTYTWNLITNTTSGTNSTTQFNSFKQNANNTLRYFGVATSNLNSSGKSLFIGVSSYNTPSGYSVSSNLGPIGYRFLGVGSVQFYVEQ